MLTEDPSIHSISIIFIIICIVIMIGLYIVHLTARRQHDSSVI